MLPVSVAFASLAAADIPPLQIPVKCWIENKIYRNEALKLGSNVIPKCSQLDFYQFDICQNYQFDKFAAEVLILEIYLKHISPEASP